MPADLVSSGMRCRLPDGLNEPLSMALSKLNVTWPTRTCTAAVLPRTMPKESGDCALLPSWVMHRRNANWAITMKPAKVYRKTRSKEHAGFNWRRIREITSRSTTWRLPTQMDGALGRTHRGRSTGTHALPKMACQKRNLHLH